MNEVFGFEDGAADAYYQQARKYEMKDAPEKAVDAGNVL